MGIFLQFFTTNMLIYDDYKENYYISKALLIESNQFMKNIMNLGKKKKKKNIYIE